MQFYTDEEIGKIIKHARIYKNMTQGELGERVGVQAAAVQKWESGKVKNIKREVLQKLAVELGVSPITLVGFKQIETPLIGFDAKELKRIEEFMKKIKEERSDN